MYHRDATPMSIEPEAPDGVKPYCNRHPWLFAAQYASPVAAFFGVAIGTGLGSGRGSGFIGALVGASLFFVLSTCGTRLGVATHRSRSLQRERSASTSPHDDEAT
jgi:hypothetical protein